MFAHRFLLIAALVPSACAQITPMDTVFAGLSARTRQLTYQSGGGDMTPIAPLMANQNYRSITHATVLMNGIAWTPDAELSTGLDFAISAKLVGTGAPNRRMRIEVSFTPCLRTISSVLSPRMCCSSRERSSMSPGF